MIKPTVQVKGNWMAHEAILKALRKADGSYFSVGVHTDAGQYPARRKRNRKGQFSGMTTPPEVYQVAWWLEKGTEHMPARPFLNPAINDNLPIIKAAIAEGLAGVAFHEWTVARGLTMGASICLTLIQNKIKSNVGPALSGTWDPPSGYLGYKREHGMGQRTLIATGLLYRSIGYKLMDRYGRALAESSEPDSAPGADDHDMDNSADKRAEARQQALDEKAQRRQQRESFKKATHKERQDQRREYARTAGLTTARKATNRTSRINKPKK